MKKITAWLLANTEQTDTRTHTNTRIPTHTHTHTHIQHSVTSTPIGTDKHAHRLPQINTNKSIP